MGRILTNVGTPPDIETDFAAWADWRNSIVDYALTSAPRTRTTELFIQQSGSGSAAGGSGTGTQGSPYLCNTWTDLATLVNSLAGTTDRRIRVKRGDTYRGISGGISLTTDGVTLDTWGVGRNPICVFGKTVSGLWAAGLGDRYSISESNDVSWVMVTAKRLSRILRRVTSTSLVESTPDSFYYDSAGTTLHVNVGADPSTVGLEAIVSNSTSGIQLSADGVRVHGFDLYGFGCHRTSTATQAEGVHAMPSGTKLQVVTRCGSWFGGSHSMAGYTNSSGGSIVMLGNRTGLTKFNGSAGETCMNFFAAGGGQESIAIANEVTHGTLPSSDWLTGTAVGYRGIGMYGHTTGGTSADLYLWEGNRIANGGAWCAGLPSSPGNPVIASTLADCRSFVVAEDYRGFGQGSSIILATASTCRMNCMAELRPSNSATETLWGSAVSGWLINCRISADWQDWTALRASFYNTASSAKYWQNLFHMFNCSVQFGFNRNTYLGNGADTCEAKNNIIIFEGTGNGYAGINNVATLMKNNAYHGLIAAGSGTGKANGHDRDAGAVELGSPGPYTWMVEDFDTYKAGTTDIVISRDARSVLRPTPPSIGPFEVFKLAESSGDGGGSPNALALAGATVTLSNGSARA